MNPPKDEQEYAFVGLSTGHQKKLTTRNDPVAFCDKLKKVMAGEEGGIWAMPEDQTTVDGISTLPQADYLTPMRVECFMKLVSPNLATRAAMIPNTMVEVYPIQGGRAILPFHEVTVTDWARLLVAEVSKQGDSEYMVQRGIISGRCFGGFVYDLAGRANRYHPGTELTLTPKDRDLEAVGLRSLKKSLDEEDGHYTKNKESLGKRKASRSFNSVRAIAKPVIALLEDLVAQASEEEEDAESSEGELMGAFANVPASTPGRHGTPFIAKKRARRNEPPQVKRPFARREGTPTPTPIATASPEEKNKEGRLESEMPHPDNDQEVINQAIRRRNVCFYHARGDTCPHQQAGCRFSHDSTVIPFGYYPRNKIAALSELTRVEMEQAYGEATTPSVNPNQQA